MSEGILTVRTQPNPPLLPYVDLFLSYGGNNLGALSFRVLEASQLRPQRDGKESHNRIPLKTVEDRHTASRQDKTTKISAKSSIRSRGTIWPTVPCVMEATYRFSRKGRRDRAPEFF